MILKMQQLKLRNQIFLMVALCGFVVIITQTLYLTFFSRVNRRAQVELLDGTMAQIEIAGQRLVTDLNEALKMISLNDSVYEFSVARTPGERLRIFNSITVVIDSIKRFNDDIIEIALINDDSLYIGSSGQDDRSCLVDKISWSSLQDLQGIQHLIELGILGIGVQNGHVHVAGQRRGINAVGHLNTGQVACLPLADKQPHNFSL